MARTVLLLLGLLAASCSSSRRTEDAHPGGPPEPEERFGNDLELVSRFVALKSCSYQASRLDYSCPALKELRQRLESWRAQPERQGKLVPTLLNLLESKQELRRLIAAELLFYDHREPRVVKALAQALGREKVPTVKATLLRQLCWNLTPEVERTALALLDRTGPEVLRAEAALCLGRGGRLTAASVAGLREALRGDPAPAVRGNACAALGSARAKEAVAEMAAALTAPEVDWRCSMALAAVGTREAYLALVAGVEAAAKRGVMPTQHVSALASFAESPFFSKSGALALLSRVVGDRKLSWVARKRAVAELSRLGGKAELRKLRSGLEGEPDEADGYVKAELDRVLSR